MSKELRLRECRRAERRYSTFKVRKGGGEKILLVQDKEQQLLFAGAAMKRYPMSKVRETQVRQALKRASEDRQTETIFTENSPILSHGPQPCLTQ